MLDRLADLLDQPTGLIDPRLLPVTAAEDMPPDKGDAASAVPADLNMAVLLPPEPVPADSWATLPDEEASLARGRARKAPLVAPRMPRVCHVGCVGPDVKAYKRALIASGARNRADGTKNQFNHGFKLDVERFQKNHKLTPDGIIGKGTYRQIVAYCDAYGLWLIRRETRQVHVAETMLNANQKCVNHALRAVALAAYWHYEEWRPIPFGEAPDHVPTTTDCSGGYGLWRKWGGGQSPFGSLGWSGAGNTDTMLSTGTHVVSPGPGDAILYANPGHVIMCVHWPMGVSHGSEGGPYYTDVRYKPIYTFRHYT